MTREQIEKAANEAVQEHFQCNGKYPCEERDYCEFCNGNNSAFDCNEDCGADDFNEGFIAGAQWCINSVWHDARKDVPKEFIPILVERDDFTFSVNMVGGNMTSCPLHWVHWAYVIDLLPERKEETK